jgi:hypothetical protein
MTFFIIGITFIAATAIHKHTTGHRRFACFRRFLHSLVRDISGKKKRRKREGEQQGDRNCHFFFFHLTEEGRRKEDGKKQRRTYVRVCRFFVPLDILCTLISGLFASVLEHIKYIVGDIVEAIMCVVELTLFL